MTTQVFSFAKRSIPNGTFSIPATAIGLQITSLTLALACCTSAAPDVWPNASTTVDAQLEVSYDGGATWQPGGGLSHAGGISVRRGVEAPLTKVICTYSAVPTHFRGSVVVAGGPLVTSGSVTVEP